MSWEAAASVAGPIISGMMGQGAQSSANASNVKIARMQQDFQERMSNTAHQREVEDLRKAGLNPVLSANSGASTPSGASTTVLANNELGKGLERSVANAVSARRLKQDIAGSEANIALSKASALTQASQAELNATNAVAAKANAKNVALRNSALEAQMPAIARRADVDLKHAEIDAKWATEDAILRRTGQATGAVGNLFGVGKFLKGLLPGSGNRGAPRRSSGYSEEHYSQQGEHMGTKVRKYLD